MRPPVRRIRRVTPNAGTQAAYRKTLERWIQAMATEVLEKVREAWSYDPPATMAQDAGAMDNLTRVMDAMSDRWVARFDAIAEDLAEYFGAEASERAESSLQAALRDGGITVRFRPSAATKQVIDATVQQSVSLIKSIPRKYLEQVRGDVTRSVQEGRDLASLTRQLQQKYGATRERAALIARDQNNKATSALVKQRQIDLGGRARWRHSHAGKHPRSSHVRADGKIYDPRKGMYLDGKWTWPGVEINCRCTSETVMPWHQ